MELAKWTRMVDHFSDRVFWQHAVTGDVTWYNPATAHDAEVLLHRNQREPSHLPQLLDERFGLLPDGEITPSEFI